MINKQPRHSGDIFSSASQRTKENGIRNLVFFFKKKKTKRDSGLNFLSPRLARRRESFSGMTDFFSAMRLTDVGMMLYKLMGELEKKLS